MLAKLGNLHDYSVDEINAKIQDLYNTGDTFQSMYDSLKNEETTAASDPALYADYNALMSKGAQVQSAITKAVSSIQAINDYISGAQEKAALSVSDFFWNLLHPNEVKADAPTPLQGLLGGLGFVPLIPLALGAALLAALALAAAWIVDARSMVNRLELQKQMIDSLPADQRQAAVDLALKTQQTKGVTENLANFGMWIAIAAGVILVAPKLLSMRGHE